MSKLFVKDFFTDEGKSMFLGISENQPARRDLVKRAAGCATLDVGRRRA